MNKHLRIILLIGFLLPGALTQGQSYLTVEGRITNDSGNVLGLVNIIVPGTSIGTASDSQGYFSLRLPVQDTIMIRFSMIGYQSQTIYRYRPFSGDLSLSIQMQKDISQLGEVRIAPERETEAGFVMLKMREIRIIPSVSGQVESYLRTLPGVSSTSELSSQISVRGGNFDENLIYINDIEVYKPFLIRAGQQEGLSIVNAELASSVSFSAGGFNASFGDRMSSVMDIRYKIPTRTGGGFELSLLGASVFFEGRTKDSKFTWLFGGRYRSNQYLLNTLDTHGNYKPQFGDIQTFLSYKLNPRWTLELLGNIGINNYQFFPEDRRTSFGTVVDAVQLYIVLNGQETDKFNTYLGALSAVYKPTDRLTLKFIGHGFQTIEEENFDIEGYYSLNELDKELGSENLGDSIMNIGLGRFIDHSRNQLKARVMGFSHKGEYGVENTMLKWGLTLQQEHVLDHLNEWKMVDSAGFSIPYDGRNVNLAYRLFSDNELNSIRLMSYFHFQNRFQTKSADLELDIGLRTNFWDFNSQWVFSPRLSFLVQPKWKKDVRFRFATGYYSQPPFHREMRRLDGTLNSDIRAQRSVHFMLGSTYRFHGWGRPFQFTADIYYKHLTNLITYKLDNVRILYSGNNDAKGYATGIEFKINGEFVKGAESWFSLSLMQTRQKLVSGGVSNEELTGRFYPRPTDQLINLGLFFQDYFPNNPTFKVYLTILYGSGLPTSSPNNLSGESYFRMPAYGRVDIGLSKILKDENSILGEKGPFKVFQTAWISLEVFNLLGINNTISYTWLTTVNNLSGEAGEFAIPNYLTSRRINLKLTATF